MITKDEEKKITVEDYPRRLTGGDMLVDSKGRHWVVADRLIGQDGPVNYAIAEMVAGGQIRDVSAEQMVAWLSSGIMREEEPEELRKIRRVWYG
jgi:hypothetical protein